MKRLLIRALMLGAAVVVPASARAQVGYPPAASPYHDLTNKQELSLYGGYFGGNAGEAGVTPGSGTLVGVRYGLHIAGPAELSVHVARAFATRTVLDPTHPASTRNLGSTSTPLYLADVGFTFNLTGQKSYHRLVPFVGFGAGLASDLGATPDVGGFSVGTAFALTGNAGIRYVPGGHISVRLGVADYLYKVSYPSLYFAAPAGGAPILGPAAGTSQWLHNATLTLGISYLISR